MASNLITVYDKNGKSMLVGANSAAARGENPIWKPKETVSNADVIANKNPVAAPVNSHQEWINNPQSGQGGMDNYTAKQQDKWNAAVAAGDYDTMDRLYADMSRVGYSLDTNSAIVARGNEPQRGAGYTGQTYTPPEFVMPPTPTLGSGRSMADLLGINYDYDSIHQKYTDAVNTKYANLDTEYGRTQDMFYDNIAGNADVLMGALRRGDRDAVQAGTTAGTQAAQELSTMLGISTEATQGATELSQARSDLVTQRETEMAKVAQDALKYYNDLGMNLGALSNSELNALVTAYASEVATLGGVYNTDVLAGVERDRIASQETIADQDRGSREAIAEQDRLSRERIAEWNNASNEAIAAATGESQQAVERIRAESNEAIAAINTEVARLGYKSGSYGGAGNPANPTLSPMERINAMYGLLASGAFEGDQKQLEFVQRALLNDLGLWEGYEQKTIKDVMHPTGSYSSNPYDAIIKNYTLKKNPTKKDVDTAWEQLNKLYNVPR